MMDVNEMKVKSKMVTAEFNNLFIEQGKCRILNRAAIDSIILNILVLEKLDERQLRYFVNQVQIQLMEDIINSGPFLKSNPFKDLDIQWPAHLSDENPLFQHKEEIIDAFNKELSQQIENLQHESDKIVNELGNSGDLLGFAE